MSITAEVIQKDQQYSVPVAGSAKLSSWRAAKASTVYDAEGKAYTDWVAGIAVNALGYGDEGTQGGGGQTDGHWLDPRPAACTTRKPMVELAELLCKNSFADKAYFCNSGAEANEGALKFARKFAYVNEQAKQDQRSSASPKPFMGGRWARWR